MIETSRGIVLETLPNLQYRIKLDSNKEIIAHTSGKMKINKIKVIIGDKVEVVIDPYGGHATNRIIKRI